MRGYYIDPLLLGPPSRWAPALDQCADMGFDTVVIAPPFESVLANDRFLVEDYMRCDARIGDMDVADMLSGVADVCASRNLILMLDIAPDRCAASNPDVRGNPHLYTLCAPPGAALPDPRAPSSTLLAAAARFGQDDARDELQEIWSKRIAQWLDCGIGGFRCAQPARLPGRAWRALIDAARSHAPATRFAAWTPGLASGELAAIRDCGFEVVYASLPWWDFRADWWLDEDQRLRRMAPVVAPLEDPLGTRLADRCTDSEHYRRSATRLLDFAAAFNDGMLVTMGFESGTAALQTGAEVAGMTNALWHAGAALDLRSEIKRANSALAARDEPERTPARNTRELLGGQTPAAAWLLESGAAQERARARLLLISLDLERVVVLDGNRILRNSAELSRFSPVHPADGGPLASGSLIAIEPGEVRVLEAEPPAPIVSKRASENLAKAPALRQARIALENLSPVVDAGRFAVKRTVGENVRVEVDAFSDGHDALAVELLWRASDTSEWSRERMRALDNDRWAAEFLLEREGRHRFTVRAWIDPFAGQRRDLQKKLSAGVVDPVDIDECCKLVADTARAATGEVADALRSWTERLVKASPAEQVEALLSAELSTSMSEAGSRDFLATHPLEITVEAERLAARFASWYELFPRSQGVRAETHGTFDDVIRRLPAIHDMGFDVLYMPPIHPIGTTQRKGRNNRLAAEPGDPGSPYAIGSADGGHDTIHPELGSFADFDRMRAAAERLGIEVALDFAIQCSPDHPWLREHPEWFAWRADGSVRHAENPPKKYEDIVNVDFYAERAIPELWRALRDIVLFWIEHGVRLFRVDNPHTKPFPFWEWMIADVRARHPDAIFLAEAFTRPKPMYRLAKLGFSQSYTYFTWRNSKIELTDYFTELAETAVRDYFRPHLFVNTPDINPVFLQQSGRPGFLIRAALAATLSGLWGMYSGFELCESAPVAGKEEYLDSEKYQLRQRDWNMPGNIVDEIRRLNAIRRMNPALQDHRNVRFYNAFNDQILYFGKATPGRDNAILVAVNLDPHATQAADFEVPLWEWDLPDHESVIAEDLVRGTSETWRGKVQHLSLDPSQPFAIWRVRPETSTWT
ncbi:MAG: maltotransferase domain-containing protein [Rhodanobacteraceae bacterium]